MAPSRALHHAFVTLLLFVLVAPAAAVSRIPDASGSKSWSPRDEIAPQFSIEPPPASGGSPVLKITARKASDFGAWQNTLQGLRAGQVYRFSGRYRTAEVENTQRSVIARLAWLDAAGK